MRLTLAMGLILIAAGFTACGNGSSSSSSSSSSSTPATNTTNSQPISVDGGPAQNYENGVFTTVQICVPGSSTCQQISNILVDTGSYGLRILASALSLSLPEQTDASGNTIAECALFVDSFTWGPVAAATIDIADEKADDIPVQIIGASNFPSPPADCLSSALPAHDTQGTLGANGILGIGVFGQDCGPACATSGSSNPGFYYSCPSSGCVVTEEGVAAQVQNPVPFFSKDNNGEVVELPAIGASGSASVSGSLIFGIGTESNNGLGSAQVFTTDDAGDISTTFEGNSYTSFIDSGSNGLFFLSSAVTGIGTCTNNSAFYCPPSTVNLSAENVGQNDTSGSVAFSVANAEQLFSTNNLAFNDLAGPNPNIFDWGVPFFYGRNVFVAIDGQSTPAGPGPYYAY
jgi:hypothetical protein